jgi:hypothetical protein
MSAARITIERKKHAGRIQSIVEQYREEMSEKKTQRNCYLDFDKNNKKKTTNYLEHVEPPFI